MYKKLARHGNSSALVLEKPILELLNITDTTQLKVTTDGTSLIITPVQQPVAEQPQEDVMKPFKDLVNAMPENPEVPQFIKDHLQNPTVETQKAVLEFYEKRKELYKLDPQFWETRKKVMDAYMPSFDENMKAMLQDFKDVDLKKLPEHVQKAYLISETHNLTEEQKNYMQTQEYLHAIKQVTPLLSEKFTQLFQQVNTRNGDLHKQMLENFQKARLEKQGQTTKA